MRRCSSFQPSWWAPSSPAPRRVFEVRRNPINLSLAAAGGVRRLGLPVERPARVKLNSRGCSIMIQSRLIRLTPLAARSGPGVQRERLEISISSRRGLAADDDNGGGNGDGPIEGRVAGFAVHRKQCNRLQNSNDTVGGRSITQATRRENPGVQSDVLSLCGFVFNCAQPSGARPLGFRAPFRWPQQPMRPELQPADSSPSRHSLMTGAVVVTNQIQLPLVQMYTQTLTPALCNRLN